MGGTAITIERTAAERAELEGLAGRWRTAQGMARRARIVLAVAEGRENKGIAPTLGADPTRVGANNPFSRIRRSTRRSEVRVPPARSRAQIL